MMTSDTCPEVFEKLVCISDQCERRVGEDQKEKKREKSVLVQQRRSHPCVSHARTLRVFVKTKHPFQILGWQQRWLGKKRKKTHFIKCKAQ